MLPYNFIFRSALRNLILLYTFRLFDICNSRNPSAKGFKEPLKLSNLASWRPFMERARLYLMNLRDIKGIPVIDTRKKTALVGFIADIQSINGIFQDLCEGPQPKLKYVILSIIKIYIYLLFVIIFRFVYLVTFH